MEIPTGIWAADPWKAAEPGAGQTPPALVGTGHRPESMGEPRTKDVGQGSPPHPTAEQWDGVQPEPQQQEEVDLRIATALCHLRNAMRKSVNGYLGRHF